MQCIGRALPVALLAFCSVSGSPVWADGKLTEANMTQRDFARVTATESSVPDQPKTVAPTPIHAFSDAAMTEIEAAHGTRVVSGKTWNHETPEQRDAHLRRIKETMPDGSFLVIVVPQGDVWLVPPDDDGKVNGKLVRDGTIRIWHEWERLALPESVGNKNVSDDRGGRHGEIPLAAGPRFVP